MKSFLIKYLISGGIILTKIEQKGKVSFKQAIKDFFLGYFDFKGQTTRAGYWWVILAFILLTIITLILGMFFFFSMFVSSSAEALKRSLIVVSIFILFIIIPSLALNVRRIRDVGLTGWGTLCLYLLAFILFMAQGTYSYVYNFDFIEGSKENITLGNNILVTFLDFTINILMLLLTIFPTNMLTTKSENKILRFFFRLAE